MLRLGQDQECYDFIKWWETGAEHHVWGGMSLPYLPIRDADVLEKTDFLLHRYGNLWYLVAIQLLKFKMLIDIRTIKISRKIAVAGNLPGELWEHTEKHALQSSPFMRSVNKSSGDVVRMEMLLQRQCLKIGAAIVEANQHFMFEMMVRQCGTCQKRIPLAPLRRWIW